MIIGIGIDIIDIPRVKKIAEEFGEDFVSKIFADNEIAYCKAKKTPEINLAARFAAKEAFLKALGTGLRGGIDWKDIQIVNDDLGNPFICLEGNAKKLAAKRGIVTTHLSISHTSEYATAMVVLED